MFIGGASVGVPPWENAETQKAPGSAEVGQWKSGARKKSVELGAGEDGRAMFTAHDSKRGTRRPLVEVTVEDQLTEYFQVRAVKQETAQVNKV